MSRTADVIESLVGPYADPGGARTTGAWEPVYAALAGGRVVDNPACPEQTVSIIDMNDVHRPTVRTVQFTQLKGPADALRRQGICIYGPNAMVAQDVEPE